MSQALKDIFKMLIDNKAFPNYQAERRVDIFINFFAKRILDSFLQETTTFVCPEFPLKLEKNNRSTKLDYLYVTKTQPVFIELKTDTFSLKESQAKSYLDCNWNKCVSDLSVIEASTSKNYKQKYEHLISTIRGINFPDQNPVIRVIYFSPLKKVEKELFKDIHFKEIKKISELTISISEEEKIVWDFIDGLDLYVSEIGSSS
jgi:hypothetical protein